MLGPAAFKHRVKGYEFQMPVILFLEYELLHAHVVEKEMSIARVEQIFREVRAGFEIVCDENIERRDDADYHLRESGVGPDNGNARYGVEVVYFFIFVFENNADVICAIENVTGIVAELQRVFV